MTEGDLRAGDPFSGWTAAEAATLAVVAETFVRGGGERRARLAAEALQAGTDPADIARLRRALRLFENPAANMVVRVPAEASSPARSRRQVARSSCSRPGRSWRSPRCPPASWPRSTGSTLITA